jgi:hypothetical protein
MNDETTASPTPDAPSQTSAVLEAVAGPHVFHVPVSQPEAPLAFANLGSTDAIALPQGYKLEDTTKFAGAPRDAAEKVKLKTLPDFLAYVNRYKAADSLVLLNGSLASLGTGEALATATLDYHERPDASGFVMPRWGKHVVSFHPTPTPAYALLCAIDNKLEEQDVFAQHLRDLARFCSSHAAAELLEIVRTLTLASSGEYQSHSDDISGSVRLRYQVQVEARAGTSERTLTVPTAITFTVPVFLGETTANEILAEYMYRPPTQSGGKVRMGIRMPDRLWLEHAIIERTAKEIRDNTGLLVATGSK